MMVAKHYGKCLSQDLILDILKVTRKGVSLLAIGNAAKKVGFCTMALRAKPKYLKKVNLPIIIYWNQNHFVVLFKIKNSRYYIADPEVGLIEYTKEDFSEHWLIGFEGIILTFSVSSVQKTV